MRHSRAVEDVSFNPEDDTFTVRYHGDELDLARVNEAVRGKVIAKPLRKLLDWIGRPFRAVYAHLSQSRAPLPVAPLREDLRLGALN